MWRNNELSVNQQGSQVSPQSEPYTSNEMSDKLYYNLEHFFYSWEQIAFTYMAKNKQWEGDNFEYGNAVPTKATLNI